jgi:hypothetical protein
MHPILTPGSADRILPESIMTGAVKPIIGVN